jgi:hypothetical protein
MFDCVSAHLSPLSLLICLPLSCALLQAQIVDICWTYMRALDADPSLVPTWPTSLFLGYLLTHTQDHDGTQVLIYLYILLKYITTGVCMVVLSGIH